MDHQLIVLLENSRLHRALLTYNRYYFQMKAQIVMVFTKPRLVKLATDTCRYAEVDERRLKRETVALLAYIRSHIDPNKDENDVWKWVVPLCERVLAGTIHLPLPFSELPLKHAVRERLFTSAFETVLAKFSLTICASPREMYEEIVIDGVRHAYVDFEE